MSEAARPGAPRPRVAQVTPEPDRPGGMAAVVRDLLASPLAERYQLDLIVTYNTRSRWQRVTVFARALGRLARWCRGEGRRLVHVHTAVRGSIYRKAVCVVVAKAAGRPVLLHLHAGAGDIEEFADRIGAPRRALLARAMRTADAVISVSEPGARQIERSFGVSGLVVIPNAAPPARQIADAAAPPAREVAGAAAENGTGPRALYMGGFVNPAKGGRVLVEALPRLLEACPELEVTVAGTGSPPAELEALAREDARVTWAGWLDADAKAAALAGCDVFVMPSLSEGMPVALLEAMAYGRAIVASEVGGIPDVVGAGDAALLVPSRDPGALAAGVARVAGDEELRERLGLAALELVKAYDADAVYERLAGLYDELLAR